MQKVRIRVYLDKCAAKINENKIDLIILQEATIFNFNKNNF